jgi:hypothetical protein
MRKKVTLGWRKSRKASVEHRHFVSL